MKSLASAGLFYASYNPTNEQSVMSPSLRGNWSHAKSADMAAYRHAMGHHGGRKLTAGAAAALGALLLILVLAERGTFMHAASATGMATLPGITLDDDDTDRLPVVTSVRSDGQAERAGIRAGDEIAAVDGRAVHDVATVRAALVADRRSGPVALHIRRGGALWTVAIDRAEPSAERVAATDMVNGP